VHGIMGLFVAPTALLVTMVTVGDDVSLPRAKNQK